MRTRRVAAKKKEKVEAPCTVPDDDVVAWLCPKLLRCARCDRCLDKPVLLKNEHVCRACMPSNDPALRSRKPEQSLLSELGKWRQFVQSKADQLDCPICRTFMLEPVGLSCCGHMLCFGCVQQMSECPLCRAEVKPLGRWSISGELVALMEERFDPQRMSTLRRARQAETQRHAELLQRSDAYLASDRWRDLHTAAKLICKQAVLKSWCLELPALRARLAEEVASLASSPLSDAEFSLLLSTNRHITNRFLKVGQLLLTGQQNLAHSVLQHQGACTFAELQPLIVAAALVELLEEGADADLICVWLQHNGIEPRLVDQFRQPVEWFDEELSEQQQRQAASRFVGQIAELDLIDTRPHGAAPVAEELSSLSAYSSDSAESS